MTAKKQMAVDEDIHDWLETQKLCKKEPFTDVLRRKLHEQMEKDK